MDKTCFVDSTSNATPALFSAFAISTSVQKFLASVFVDDIGRYLDICHSKKNGKCTYESGRDPGIKWSLLELLKTLTSSLQLRPTFIQQELRYVRCGAISFL